MATLHLRGTKFYASFKDRNGRWVLRSTGSAVKEDAQIIANDMESKEKLVSRGLVDEERIRPKKLFAEAVVEYEAKQKAANNTAHHIVESVRIVKAFGSSQNCKYVTDLNDSSLEKYLAGFDAAASTKKKHLTVLRSFAKRNRIHLEPIRIKLEDKQVRRMLHYDEWAYLKTFLSTPHRKRRRKEGRKTVTGPRLYNSQLVPAERLLIYSLALQSALRVNEMMSLKPSDLHAPEDEAQACYVTCSNTKNGKRARQFITRPLALQLQGKLPLKMPPRVNVARVAQTDLADARQHYLRQCEIDGKEPEPYFLAQVNDRGEHFTAHSFRHTCLSWLALQNTPIPVLMRIARHSDPNLTLKTYGHIYKTSESDEILRCKYF